MADTDDKDHEHEFKQYRDGRPPHCKCGAWLRKTVEVVTDEPIPDRREKRQSR